MSGLLVAIKTLMLPRGSKPSSWLISSNIVLWTSLSPPAPSSKRAPVHQNTKLIIQIFRQCITTAYLHIFDTLVHINIYIHKSDLYKGYLISVQACFGFDHSIYPAEMKFKYHMMVISVSHIFKVFFSELFKILN